MEIQAENDAQADKGTGRYKLGISTIWYWTFE